MAPEAVSGSGSLRVSSSKKRHFNAFMASVLFALLIICVVVGSFFSTRLRPFADDYCNAVNGAEGLIPYVERLYQTWSGDVLAVAQVHLFVGASIRALPWWLASATSFTAGTALIAVCGFMMSRRIFHLQRFGSATFGLLLVVCWWTIWWLPTTLFPGDNGIFGDVNVQQIYLYQTVYMYTVYSFLVILLTLLSLLVPSRYQKLRSFLWFFTGLYASLSLLTSGATLLAVSLLYILWQILGPVRPDYARITGAISLSVGCVIGLSVSILSPGASIRRTFFQPVLSTDPSLANMFQWITYPVPSAISTWSQIVFSPGVLFAVGLSFVATLIFRRANFVVRYPSTLPTVFLLVLIALVNSIIVRIGQGFAYGAGYHFIPTVALVLLAAVLFGNWIGTTFNALQNGRRPETVAIGLLILLPLALASVAQMGSAVTTRWMAWERGPAPIAGLGSDLENYSLDCWTRLAELRDVPQRGVEP